MPLNRKDQAELDGLFSKTWPLSAEDQRKFNKLADKNNRMPWYFWPLVGYFETKSFFTERFRRK